MGRKELWLEIIAMLEWMMKMQVQSLVKAIWIQLLYMNNLSQDLIMSHRNIHINHLKNAWIKMKSTHLLLKCLSIILEQVMKYTLTLSRDQYLKCQSINNHWIKMLNSLSKRQIMRIRYRLVGVAIQDLISIQEVEDNKIIKVKKLQEVKIITGVSQTLIKLHWIIVDRKWINIIRLEVSKINEWLWEGRHHPITLWNEWQQE